MKYASLGKMPWDMVVFLTLTTAGFGLSVKQLVYPEPVVSSAIVESAQRKPTAIMVAKTSVLDLGCLETLIQKQNRNVWDRTVRFKGKLCYTDRSRSEPQKLTNVNIINLSTGADVTVFFQNGDSSFLTDNVLLQAGRNVVQMQWRDSVSKEEKVIVTEVYGK